MNLHPSLISRRHFLALGGVAAASAFLAACGTPKSVQKAGDVPGAPQSENDGTLRIVQLPHFVPAYDEWFDKDFTQKWGSENGVKVVVDHLPNADLYARAALEATSQSGHDIFGFTNSPAAFERDALDLTPVVQTLEAKLGKMSDIAQRSTYNPRTNKYYGLSDSWVPGIVHWRKDLWEQVKPGGKPDSWQEIVGTGSELKKMGHPVGIGFSPEMDSNTTLASLLFSFGASIHDEYGNVTIKSTETGEALHLALQLYNKAMTPEVLGWSSSSINQFILSGDPALVVNAISTLRTAENSNPDLAKLIYLEPTPAGPKQRVSAANLVNAYVVWSFTKQSALAQKFLVDLVNAYQTAFEKSELYNLPSFLGSVPDFADRVKSDPKYALLETADKWSVNVGYPGYSNAAVNEVMDRYILPSMFARVALKELKADEAITWADGEIQAIFSQWRNLGLI